MTSNHCFTLTFERLDASGTVLESLYYGTRALVTAATDTPADATFRELVSDPGSVRRQIFSGTRGAGLVAPTWGSVELINAGGDFDSWLDSTLDGWRITCRWGPHGGAYPADWSTVYVAWVDGPPQMDARRVTLRLRGRERIFDAQIITTTFDGSAGTHGGYDLNGSGIADGRLHQIVIGTPAPYEPILLSETDNLWFVTAGIPAAADY